MALRANAMMRQLPPGSLDPQVRKDSLIHAHAPSTQRYSSTLYDWRRQRDAGALGALTPARRGPKALEANPLTAKVALLEKNNAHLMRSLARAEAITPSRRRTAPTPPVSRARSVAARIRSFSAAVNLRRLGRLDNSSETEAGAATTVGLRPPPSPSKKNLPTCWASR
jgi:hypothetical protein